MVQLSFPNFFDGTPRPAWAGPVLIIAQNFRQSRSHSDVRYTNITAQGILRRPTQIEGVVLTVTSRGRVANIAVQARSLRFTGYDVGHLFALSSGGPEEDVQYVPQHASINRASLRTGGEVAIDSLNWRQLEVYAQYLCQQGFANANLPGPGDRVTITEGKKPNGQGISIKVNGTDLTFQPTTLYAGAGPHVCFKWKVVPTYPPSQSMILPTGNDPAMIKVTLSYARAPAYNAWTDLCAITFRNNPKFSSDLGKLDKINSKFKTKMKETRVAAAYAAAHPRRGNR